MFGLLCLSEAGCRGCGHGPEPEQCVLVALPPMHNRQKTGEVGKPALERPLPSQPTICTLARDCAAVVVGEFAAKALCGLRRRAPKT